MFLKKQTCASTDSCWDKTEKMCIRDSYETADNPTFEVFYLAEAKAVIADFSGNPPREYSF